MFADKQKGMEDVTHQDEHCTSIGITVFHIGAQYITGLGRLMIW
jgi:hypothetical protein